MSQYILTYPIDGKIYYSSTPKNAAKKAFLYLAKHNYDQSRIILKDNNTKKEYNYIGMTNTKLDEYNKIIKSKNPIQLGGGNELSDKEFYNKLSKLSGNINVSIDELSKILKAKYEPKENNDFVLLVKDGINKLDQLNNNVTNINEEINIIRNKLVPEAKTSNKNIISPQNIVDIDHQKNIIDDVDDVDDIGEIDDKNDKIDNLDQVPPVENESGFCTIM